VHSTANLESALNAMATQDKDLASRLRRMQKDSTIQVNLDVLNYNFNHQSLS